MRRQLSVSMLVGLGIGLMIVQFGAGIALVAPAVLGLLALVAYLRSVTRGHYDDEARQRMLKWTLASFALHLLVGLALTNLGGSLHRYFAAPDASAYNLNAILLARHWHGGFPGPQLPAGKEGFYYILGALYWLFGPHAAAGLALNAVLAAALVPLLADTTRRLFNTNAARYALPLAVLVPGLFIWTSQLLKEAPIFFFVALAVNGATRMADQFSLGSLLCSAVSLAALLSFRAWVGLVIAGALLAALTLGKGHLISGLGTGLGMASAVAVLLGLGLGYSGYNVAVGSDLQQANATRQGLAIAAGTGFDPNVDVSKPSGALSYLPRGLAEFVFGPFPWQFHSAQQLPVIPDVVVWWCLLPSLWRGARSGWSAARGATLILLLPASATAVLLSLSVGNYGTLVRERAQVVVILVPLIALGLAARSADGPLTDPAAGDLALQGHIAGES